MKWPSSRNSLPNGTRVVHFDRLERRAEVLESPRRPDEEAPVVGEVFGHRAGREIAGADPRSSAARQASLPPRMDRLELRALRLQRRLERAEQLLGLAVLSVVRLQT